MVFAKLHLAIIITPKANPVTTPAPGFPQIVLASLNAHRHFQPMTSLSNRLRQTQTGTHSINFIEHLKYVCHVTSYWFILIENQTFSGLCIYLSLNFGYCQKHQRMVFTCNFWCCFSHLSLIPSCCLCRPSGNCPLSVGFSQWNGHTVTHNLLILSQENFALDMARHILFRLLQ